MKVAISGASGLIGSALHRHLIERGDEVVSLVRRDGDSDLREVAWSPGDGTIDAAGLEGVDAVVHLAGAGIGDHRWTDAYKRTILESRTTGTWLLASTIAGLDRPPAVFVSGSAIGFYGDRGDERLDETSKHGEGFLADVVVAWEAAAEPARSAGIRTVTARTGIVLDRKEGALSKLLPLFKFGLGGRMGSGRQWWSWISLDDEVRALTRLIDSELDGPVNLTAPGAVTNRDFTRVLGEVLGRPTFMTVPEFGPKLLRGSELAQELLFASQRVEPSVLEHDGFVFEHPSLDQALRAVLDRPA